LPHVGFGAQQSAKAFCSLQPKPEGQAVREEPNPQLFVGSTDMASAVFDHPIVKCPAAPPLRQKISPTGRCEGT
jgi:hypothetical protein